VRAESNSYRTGDSHRFRPHASSTQERFQHVHQENGAQQDHSDCGGGAYNPQKTRSMRCVNQDSHRQLGSRNSYPSVRASAQALGTVTFVGTQRNVASQVDVPSSVTPLPCSHNEAITSHQTWSQLHKFIIGRSSRKRIQAGCQRLSKRLC